MRISNDGFNFCKATEVTYLAIPALKVRSDL